MVTSIMRNKKTVLICGATGFIGKNILIELLNIFATEGNQDNFKTLFQSMQNKGVIEGVNDLPKNLRAKAEEILKSESSEEKAEPKKDTYLGFAQLSNTETTYNNENNDGIVEVNSNNTQPLSVGPGRSAKKG